MGVRNVIRTDGLDPFVRIGKQIKAVGEELQRLRSVVRRDCLKAQGYEIEYRTLPTPGLYVVNKRDGDPNFGVATFWAP